jgi:hypothetical protein
MSETSVLIDNSTFAAAGRVFYLSDAATEGGRHAREYYAAYHDARALDWQSAGEFLTALILFDRLCWDSASASGEAPTETDYRDPWLYAWFPLFRKAHMLGIIEDFEERYVSGERLCLAQQLAFKWVEEQIATGAHKLPRGFRVPLAYYSDGYCEREAFEGLNRDHGFPLTEHQLAIAMFLHRGLYYQSYTHGSTTWFEGQSWSYVPHAHRACLLRSPSWNLLSTICNDEELWLGAVRKLEITAPELMQELDRRFFHALDKTVKIECMPGSIALGASFLQCRRSDPTRALEDALEFRESRAGLQVRGFFSELVGLGKASNKQAIEDRLSDFEALLRDAGRSRFGTSWAADPKAGFLLGLLGSLKDVLAPVLNMVPRRTREAVTRVLYTSTQEHGFQILFKSYL